MHPFWKKTHLPLVLLLFFNQEFLAQENGTFSIQLNAARFIFPNALTNAAGPSLSFLNGIQVGHSVSENLFLYVGGKRLNYTIDGVYGYYGIHRFKGGEAYIGLELYEKQEKHAFLSFFSEIFFEKTRHNSLWGTDYSLFYEINHRKIYYGIAVGLNIQIKLNKRLFLVSGSRLNVGRAEIRGLVQEPMSPFYTVYPDEIFYKVGWDLVNNFGIRVKL